MERTDQLEQPTDSLPEMDTDNLDDFDFDLPDFDSLSENEEQGIEFSTEGEDLSSGGSDDIDLEDTESVADEEAVDLSDDELSSILEGTSDNFFDDLGDDDGESGQDRSTDESSSNTEDDEQPDMASGEAPASISEEDHIDLPEPGDPFGAEAVPMDESDVEPPTAHEDLGLSDGFSAEFSEDFSDDFSENFSEGGGGGADEEEPVSLSEDELGNILEDVNEDTVQEASGIEPGEDYPFAGMEDDGDGDFSGTGDSPGLSEEDSFSDLTSAEDFDLEEESVSSDSVPGLDEALTESESLDLDDDTRHSTDMERMLDDFVVQPEDSGAPDATEMDVDEQPEMELSEEMGADFGEESPQENEQEDFKNSLLELDEDEDEDITLTAEELGNILSDADDEEESTGVEQSDSMGLDGGAEDELPSLELDDFEELDSQDPSGATEESTEGVLDDFSEESTLSAPSYEDEQEDEELPESFFDLNEDDDEPIALSDDELENILDQVNPEDEGNAEGLPPDEAIDYQDIETEGTAQDYEQDFEPSIAAEAAEATAAAASGIPASEAMEEAPTAPPEAEEDIEPKTERSELLDQSEQMGVDREELKKMIGYLDSLFGELPDDVVKEFSKSEYFDLYKKIMTDLGV